MVDELLEAAAEKGRSSARSALLDRSVGGEETHPQNKDEQKATL